MGIDKERLPKREDIGLPEHKFIFCCFAQFHKICPRVFACWCRILKRCPNAVLWLLSWTTEGRENILAEAERRGLRRKRFIFMDVVPKAEHLKRCYLADMYLDTLNFSATSTASDVIWMGTSMITMAGQKMAART